MLAGKMKLTTFLAIAGLVGVAAIALLIATCDTQPHTTEVAADRPPSNTGNRSPQRDAPSQGPDPAHATAGGPSERPVDVAVMGWRGKDLGSDKKKDVTKGKPFKVNVYQDAGKSTMNRAKLDLDRDDKFDEKWTFDGDDISRQVAPADDENYTESYVWDGEAWAKQ